MRKIILPFLLFVFYFSGAGHISGMNVSEGEIQNVNFQPELNVYPNPCTGNKITVETNSGTLTEIKITGITGKEIFKKEFVIPENKQVIELENVPKGIYLIQVKTSTNGIFVKKLMVAEK